MRKTFLSIIVIISTFVSGFSQNHDTVYLNLEGDTVSFEMFLSLTIRGEYKMVYDRKTNVRTLEPMTDEEFQKELSRTKRKTITTDKLGEPFPTFVLQDITGMKYDSKELLGKIIVLNYWFIGCAPCEIERPVLNNIYQKYKDNDEVVFLSFAKNDQSQLEKFFVKRPFLYPVIPLNKKLIDLFGIKGYPVNQIIGKDGKYFFNSSAVGIGSGHLIEEAISRALNSEN